MQFFGGSEISPSPPVPTASGNNAHMIYIFNRNGVCLLYREWNRPLHTINSNQDHKLMFGLLFSLKSLTVKMDPSSFFPCLLKEMSAVVGCFNKRARKLLHVHLATGFRKYYVWCRAGTPKKNHGALVQEGKDLVGYAVINAIAMRKILKKYDKIHYSKHGQAFRSQVQSMHMEILQSPWLCELIAFHINLKETNVRKASLFDGCSLVFNDGKPSLSCQLSDSFKLEIDLTCSICLDTVFDSVSLTCGHIFCYMCACKSGSVTIVDGLKAARSTSKCPLCREAGVYERALHLDELNILLSRSCPKYWEERFQNERIERIKQAKEHWQSQSRAFLGI